MCPALFWSTSQRLNWFSPITNSPVRQVLLSYFIDWETEVQRDCLDQGPRSHNWEVVESGFESRQPHSHTCIPNHPLMQVAPFISFTRVFEGGLCFLWASLVAQLIKNLPAMWGTWVRSLGWGDPLEKGNATHSCILAWRIPRTVSPWGRKESDMTEWLSHFTFCFL